MDPVIPCVRLELEHIADQTGGKLVKLERPFVQCQKRVLSDYESWVVPAGVPSALADIGGGVEANY